MRISLGYLSTAAVGFVVGAAWALGMCLLDIHLEDWQPDQ